ncbi:tonsoku-like protein [Manacus candei]|uniref:tonsoku-like protein n=1 Tax=Manacus candei TaxID=415023 RepID=UPI0022274CB0|nr:tonsoku-like protein [Manacus candei]
MQSLQELDLSLNPLGSSGPSALARLLPAWPALATLGLRGCGLGGPFPLPGRSPLRSLALSYNPLGLEGLGRLLRDIPAPGIHSLELGSITGAVTGSVTGAGTGSGTGAGTGSGTGSITGGSGIGGIVRAYLEQEGCALSHLTLSGNHLGDKDIEEVARSLPSCPSLVSLDLSANPGISTEGLRSLLGALEKRGRGLEFLNLAGCSVGPLDDPTWTRSTGMIRELRLCRRRGRRDQRLCWKSS